MGYHQLSLICSSLDSLSLRTKTQIDDICVVSRLRSYILYHGHSFRHPNEGNASKTFVSDI